MDPVLQAERFDPDGDGVRRFAPELAKPADLIREPWRATPLESKSAGVELGRDYPAAIVDHKAAGERARPAYAGSFARARLRRSL